MITPPFISACLSMMESEVGEPRRVGGPTRHSMAPIRHGALPMRRGALFLLPFGQLWHLWGGATSCWRSNATWRTPNATWRARFALFLGGFGPLKLEPRRVGGPTRHSVAPMRRGALVLPSFWVFWSLWGRATSCWSPNATWRGPNTTWPSSNAAWQGAIQCDAPFSRPSNAKKPPPN